MTCLHLNIHYMLISSSGIEDEVSRQNLAALRGLENISRPQEPFQPSSTPTHLQQRFMVILILLMILINKYFYSSYSEHRG